MGYSFIETPPMKTWGALVLVFFVGFEIEKQKTYCIDQHQNQCKIVPNWYSGNEYDWKCVCNIYP